MLWVFFIAFDAFSYLKIADNKIAELKSAIERSQLNQAPVMPEPTSLVDFLQIKPEQRLAYYQAELAVLEQSKTTDSLFMLFVAIVPPLLIYLLIVWVVTGFRKSRASG